MVLCSGFFFFFQAEDGIRDFCLSRGLGDVYKRQLPDGLTDRMFYHPSENGYEKTIREYFEKIKGMQP